MKYDFELDLDTRNSLSLILKKIKPGSRVLEFGPATGRMTRYLKEQLNCRVYIVEIDPISAESASKYAYESLIGNIEEFHWYDQFREMRFDYIIFADVLEHLYNPKEVLNKSKDLLADNGSVIISVPNIAHNSVIIDLLYNKFEYRKTGLLDDTHIRFFTHSSLLNLIKSCNLEIIWQDVIIKNVGETELNNYFDGLPNSIIKYLKNREMGDVYQFIMEMRTTPGNDLTRDFNEFKSVTNNYYYNQLFVSSTNEFDEESSIKQDMVVSCTTTDYEFDVSEFVNINSLRYDPINVNCALLLERITCVDINGDEYYVEPYSSNATLAFNNRLIFSHDDPQILINAPISKLNKIIFKVKFIELEFDKIDWLVNIYNEIMELKEIEGNISRANLEDKLKTCETEKDRILGEVANLENNQYLAVSKLKKKEEEIEELKCEVLKSRERFTTCNSQLIHATNELKIKTMELDKIYASKLGKLLKYLIK